MISRVCCCYFSPCNNVKTAVVTLGQKIADCLLVDMVEFDITLPANRVDEILFSENDCVVMGSPVYAGRVPNKIMPFIRDFIHGNQTVAIPVVVYGNRSYDDALSELYLLMKGNSFCNVAAATIVSEHSFASTLATGRPDERDKEKIRRFANQVADRLKEGKHLLLEVPGANPPEKYYTPLKADGTPAKFLKAVPQTNLEKCIHCGACVDVCPMGVVHKEHPEITTGACIKCQACIHICDSQARCFDDEDFLSHRQMLKENYTGRKESEFFF